MRMTSNQPWWLTMLPAEPAATILPLFSYEPYEEHTAMANIATWCKTGSFSLRQWPSGSWRCGP
jgi:hypothetical protein